MSNVTVQQLILAGSHFGHLTRRWNPKMKPYIFMEKNGIYIIDLYKTKQLLDNACEAVRQIVERGELVLFVGTKKQARDIVQAEAARAGMPYVNERWLGGMLTNFVTIRKSVKKLENLEKKQVDGTYDVISKKERLTIDKQKEKLEIALTGIRTMKKLPGAVFVVDTLEEDIAVREARKLGIPVFALVDTNADPDPIDYPIPANDDAYKSIGLITKTFTDAVVEGLAKAEAVKQDTEEPAEEKPKDKKGARRPARRRRTGGGGKGGDKGDGGGKGGGASRGKGGPRGGGKGAPRGDKGAAKA
ncbi:30S ribosomal protein S2 [bacterium]|nr:30S ribosomal protein S2 [bacterium]